jgi:hypothetical protein
MLVRLKESLLSLWLNKARETHMMVISVTVRRMMIGTMVMVSMVVVSMIVRSMVVIPMTMSSTMPLETPIV